ncbi:hypothetical protein [Chryseobacterium sp. WX]|uniref:hypothetical protein n=1 Tax=Chryseobacterium sp. WX TaxID=3031803 RepID=UPI0024091F02|nr:hypothetical protein [Chryseobacterium sp. WX]WFB67020.1 hypothetical protein PZ898_20250 [Chryseobacterium sp. WX]
MTQRMATILVLLSSILPFLNNILKHLFNTTSIVLDVEGAKSLDLDSAIFFFAMPISYLCIAYGGRFGAHKKSYYAVYLSAYLQVVIVINFIFVSTNVAYFITQITLFVLFFVVALLLLKKAKYYTTMEAKNEFLNNTLDRYSSILREKK